MNEAEINQFRANLHTNTDFINNNSFMMARIDTSPLLRKLRKDIGGKVIITLVSKDGQEYEEEKQIGKALANNEGVMHICNLVEEMVNSHTVQGNLKADHYWDFLARCREEISDALIFNCPYWDIKDKDLDYIINKICRIIELFLTRPIDNKEREGYTKEFQSKELIQTQPEKKGIGGFTAGMGNKI